MLLSQTTSQLCKQTLIIMQNFIECSDKTIHMHKFGQFHLRLVPWSHPPLSSQETNKELKKPDNKPCKPYKPKKRKYQPNNSYTRMTTSSTADTTNREHAHLAKTAVITTQEPTQKPHKLTITEAEAEQGTQHQINTEAEAQPHTKTR